MKKCSFNGSVINFLYMHAINCVISKMNLIEYLCVLQRMKFGKLLK